MKTRIPFLIALTILALLVGACAQSASGPTKPGEVPTDVSGGAGGRDDLGGAPVPVPGEGGGFVAEEPPADQSDQSIIRTGEITIEVDTVGETTGEIRALALELDGYISSSTQGDVNEAATLTMRIPADRFDEAIAAIHDMDGEIKAEATREEDVTAAVVDLEARLKNLRAAEDEYRTLLDKAEKVEDILAIQNQLFQVRGEIEAMQAQLDYYNDQVALATLTVTVVPVPEPIEQASEDFDPAKIVEEAVASLVSFGQWLVSAAIWFVIVGLPALIVLTIIGFVGYRVFRRIRPAKPAAPAPPATPA